jgi:hypothetical protein
MHICKAFAIGLTLVSVAPAASQAARIYNKVNQTINVEGQGGPHVTIAANQRSDSLDWLTVNQVSVFPDSGTKPLCTLDFGPHAQIQGGNYMIVSGNTNCGVCDSNRHVIAGKASC